MFTSFLHLSDATTSVPSWYTCDDIILDECPDPHLSLLDTIPDTDLKTCMSLCDPSEVHLCKSFIYTNTTKVCKLYSCTVDSYMSNCAMFGTSDDTVDSCLSDDNKYPDPCKVSY